MVKIKHIPSKKPDSKYKRIVIIGGIKYYLARMYKSKTKAYVSSAMFRSQGSKSRVVVDHMFKSPYGVYTNPRL